MGIIDKLIKTTKKPPKKKIENTKPKKTKPKPPKKPVRQANWKGVKKARKKRYKSYDDIFYGK